MKDSITITKLIRYAAQWNVSIDMDYRVNFLGNPVEHHEGPGRYDILDWSKTPRIISNNGIHDTWPFLLHELAHVVCPIEPTRADELEDTMGFELLSIAWLKLPMREWNKWQEKYEPGFNIGRVYAHTWGNAPPMWRRGVMIRACEEARARGHFHPETSEPLFCLYRLIGGKPKFL